MTLLLAWLAACERKHEAPPPPPPIVQHDLEALSAGGRLFFAPTLGGLPSCVACHEVETDATRVAPSLRELRARADERIPAMDARAYTVQSIVDPGAFVVEGYADIMPRGYERSLTAPQLEQLVDFLLAEEG